MTATTLSEKIRFIESVFGSCQLARNNKNVAVKCPICAPKDPNKKKLAIKVDDDKNHCWTCGWRAHTLAPLIRKFAGREKLAEYRDRFMAASERHRVTLDEVEKPKAIELPKDFRLLALVSPSDPDAHAAKKYVESRGLTERDLWYFKLGTSKEFRWRRRVIVPSFDSRGALNYFVARAIDSNRKPKYDNPDFDKLPIVFNELNVDWTQRLVICEGAFDVFKCGDNVVALLGSDINEESALFSALLVNNTPVALALDADMWETKTIRLAKKLAEYDLDVVVVDTRPFSDPGQATKEQFKEALESAAKFDWASTFMTKLSRASRVSLSM